MGFRLQLVLFTLFSAMGFFSSLFWLPFFFQTVQGWTPFQTAIHLIPQAIVGGLASLSAGYILQRMNNSLVMGFAASCQVGSGVLLMYLRRDSEYFVLAFPALMLGSVGIELALAVSVVSLCSPSRVSGKKQV